MTFSGETGRPSPYGTFPDLRRNIATLAARLATPSADTSLWSGRVAYWPLEAAMPSSRHRLRRRLFMPAVATLLLLTGITLSGCTVVGLVTGAVVGGVLAGPDGAAAGAEAGMHLGAVFDAAFLLSVGDPDEHEDEWYAEGYEWYDDEEESYYDQSAHVVPP